MKFEVDVFAQSCCSLADHKILLSFETEDLNQMWYRVLEVELNRNQRLIQGTMLKEPETRIVSDSNKKDVAY